MDKIRDHYSRKGQTHRWVKIKAEAAKIEKKRAVDRKKANAKALAKTKSNEVLVEDLAKTFLAVVIAIIVVVVAGFLFFEVGG